MAVASEKLDTFSLTRDFFLSARRIMSSNIEGLLSSHEPRYALDFLQLCGTTVILRSSRASRWSLALRVELASVSIREPTRQCGSGWNRSLLWFRLKLGDCLSIRSFCFPHGLHTRRAGPGYVSLCRHACLPAANLHFESSPEEGNWWAIVSLLAQTAHVSRCYFWSLGCGSLSG
jgi:hypothetical protein